MSLFPVTSTIGDINNILVREYSKPGIRIIGDILLDDDDFNLLTTKLQLPLKANFIKHADNYRESLCSFLVCCAQKFYDEEGFWLHVGEHLMPMSFDRRHKIREIFVFVCRFYGFPDFENERLHGHAIITPIICHAGIPATELVLC